MTTYKVTKSSNDKSDKYFTSLGKAIDTKQLLKKSRKDAEAYHIFGMIPDLDRWFKLE